MEELYSGMKSPAAQDSANDKVQAAGQRKNRYQTFTVAARPVAPSPFSIAIWFAALGIAMVCAWLLAG